MAKRIVPMMPRRCVAAFTLAVAVSSLLAVSACSPARPHWTKAHATDQQTEADWNDCRRRASAASGAPSPGSALPDRPATALQTIDRQETARRYNALMESCMRARGYVPTR